MTHPLSRCLLSLCYRCCNFIYSFRRQCVPPVELHSFEGHPARCCDVRLRLWAAIGPGADNWTSVYTRNISLPEKISRHCLVDFQTSLSRRAQYRNLFPSHDHVVIYSYCGTGCSKSIARFVMSFDSPSTRTEYSLSGDRCRPHYRRRWS